METFIRQRSPAGGGPLTTSGIEAIADHMDQAREFLAKSRECLARGDLHQASEKGWGAAAHVVKAVAIAQGWEYERHSDFSQVLNLAYLATNDDRIRLLRGRNTASAPSPWSPTLTARSLRSRCSPAPGLPGTPAVHRQPSLLRPRAPGSYRQAHQPGRSGGAHWVAR